jgi:hypothetical protein
VTTAQIAATGAAFGAVALIALLGRATINHPALARLRVLLPAWRFFDRATRSPRLLIRSAGGEWRGLDEIAGPRPPRSALFAPHANMFLAYQAAVDQLVAELGELDLDDASESSDVVERDPRITGLVSYRLVARIAAEYANGNHEWKIVVPEGAAFVDYIASPVVEAAT